jgi:PDZ domain-containing protein
MLRPRSLAFAGALLLALVALLLWLLPSNTYIFLPDRAHAVAPIVAVQGGHTPEDGGGIYFVDIFVRKASLLERLWPGIHEGGELVPASALVPPGTSEKERRQLDANAMTRSQQVAAAVALRARGLPVVTRANGVLIDEVASDAPAARTLRASDVIVSANGRSVRTPAALRRIVGAVHPGNVVRLLVRRGNSQKRLDVRTIRGAHGRALIGVVVETAADIKLPRRVKISTGSVGGPSAGLPFALEILEKLGRDVDHGNKVAATGQIELDGTVSPIGGVRQKTIGNPRLPRSRWGERGRSAALRARHPDHPCAQLSTGVARLGNAAEIGKITPHRKRRKLHLFHFSRPCIERPRP